jgi:hypothetical protein
VPRDSSPRGTTRWPWQPRDVTRSWRPACLHFVAQSVAEEVAIPHRYATFCPNVLNDPDAQSWNALFGGPINTHRASIDLPPVEDSASSCSPITRGWRRTRSWAGGRSLRFAPSRRPLRGSCGRTPTTGRAGGVPGRRHTTGVRGLGSTRVRERQRPGRHRGDPRTGPPRTRRPRLGPAGPDR